MDFAKMEINEFTEWLLEKKGHMKLTSIDKIAADTVFHVLNTTYFEAVDGQKTYFKDVASCTYWSDNCLFVEDEVFRIYINDDYYIFSHIYITENNRVVVVAVKPEDIWGEDSDLLEEMDNLDRLYFMVEY